MIDWNEIPDGGIGHVDDVLFWFAPTESFYGGAQHAVWYDGWNFASAEVQGIYDDTNGEIVTHWAPLNAPEPSDSAKEADRG